MKVRTKILALSVTGTALTALLVVGLVTMRRGPITNQILTIMNQEAEKGLTNAAGDVYRMFTVYNETVKKKLIGDLNMAKTLMENQGAVSLADAKSTWKVQNQLSKQEQEVALPNLMVGNQWLGNTAEEQKANAFVDLVTKQTGGDLCTVFQKINDAGDMLRVSTSVKNANGTRASGTYIPAVMPDGKPNPVIAALLRGETYTGRAFVVDSWCWTAYQPLYDANRKLIGALFVGIKEGDCPELRQAVMEMVVGKTGYVYVIEGSGEGKGKYVISYKGERDGENIWDATDANGNHFIQDIINRATANPPGKCEMIRYAWQNKGETRARDKIVAFTYFAPWDWVIGAGAYEEDYHDAVYKTSTAINSLVMWGIIGGAVVFVTIGGISLLVAGRIARPLGMVTHQLQDIAQGQGDLTARLDVHGKDEIGQLAHWFNTFLEKMEKMIKDIANSASQLSSSSTGLSTTATQMASGAEEMSGQSSSVAAAAEQLTANMTNMSGSTQEMSSNVKTVAAAVEEMTASITEVARSAQEAAAVAKNAAELAQVSDQKIEQLGSAANDIGRVIDEIQDIAEQTNLLALNATIEAARAGDAGKGFAVVATEVKELAKQTAAATEDIRKRIVGIQACTAETVNSIHEISAVIANVDNVSRTIASAVEEQSITTKEIARNIAQTSTAAEMVAKGVAESASVTQQIARNISEVSLAAQQTAQGAAITQTASGQLQSVAGNLSNMVGQFHTAS
jgi:methyl-accepting chemotaxis protein